MTNTETTSYGVDERTTRRTGRSRLKGFTIAASVVAAIALPTSVMAQNATDEVATAPPPVPGGADNYVTTTTAPERSLDVRAFSPACIRDVPYINYTIVPIGFTSNGPATLTFFDVNGNFVDQQIVSTLSGQVIYPGASANASGEGADWPGWKLAPDGSWIPDSSDAILREGLTIQIEVNPTATTTVSYPAADTPCANPPSSSPPSTTQPCVPGQNNDSNPADDCDPCVPGENNDSNPAADCTLPRTGGGPGNGVIIGAGALLAGVLLLTASRRRRHTDIPPPPIT